MKFFLPHTRYWFFCLLVSFLAGCTSGGDTAYQRSRSVKVIESPPGLSQGAFGSSMPVPALASAQSVLGQKAKIEAGFSAADSVDESLLQIRRVGNKRWLVVAATPEVLWPNIREFWLENDFLIDWEDPALGVMETNWRERPAAVPTGGVAGFFSKALSYLYASDLQDKYRVRLEHDKTSGKTELFLTHRGLAGDLVGDTTKSYFWSWRPSDPEMEAEMLTRLLLFLGLDDERVKDLHSRAIETRPLASIVEAEGSAPYINLSREVASVWRLVGMALEREGLLISESNSAIGYFRVKYTAPDIRDFEDPASEILDDPEGYRITVAPLGANGSQITVANNSGSPMRDNDASRLVLEKLLKQLN